MQYGAPYMGNWSFSRHYTETITYIMEGVKGVREFRESRERLKSFRATSSKRYLLIGKPGRLATDLDHGSKALRRRIAKTQNKNKKTRNPARPWAVLALTFNISPSLYPFPPPPIPVQAKFQYGFYPEQTRTPRRDGAIRHRIDRKYALGAPEQDPAESRYRGRSLCQGRALQCWRECQGPHCPANDRGGRAFWQNKAGRYVDRAHQRKHVGILGPLVGRQF
jgi:hypothetical protein